MVDAVPAGIFYLQSKVKSVKRLGFAHWYNYFRGEPFHGKRWWPAVSINKIERTGIIGGWLKECVMFIGCKVIVADSAISRKQ